MLGYQNTRDSGIAWLGDVPADWQLLRGKFIYRNKKQINKGQIEPQRLALTLKGVIERTDGDSVGLNPASLESYQIFDANDLVFKLIDLENKNTSRVGLVHKRGIMSPAYIRLSPQIPVVAKYFYYFYYSLYLTYVFNNIAGEGVRANLSPKELLEIPVTVPNHNSQERIADYLDEETAKIDHLITKQERLLQLLEEKRRATITNAVTRGYDSAAQYKNSNIEWLGSIPEHWDTIKIKFLFKIQKRIVGKEGPDVLSITQSGIKKKDIKSGEGQLAQDYSKYQIVEIGDFAMNHMDLLTGYVDISQYSGVTSPDYRVFTMTASNQSKQFYLYLFQQCYKSRIFFPLGQGSAQLGRWRLPAEAFNNFYVPLPPLDEQLMIVEYIDKLNIKTDKLKNKIKDQISLLKERRVSLISNAVTGKIKV